MRLVIHHASQILTLRGASDAPKQGEDMSELGLVENGSIAIAEGKICAVGCKEDIDRFIVDEWDNAGFDVIDAKGKFVMPGLIDPHTHLVYAGSREYELEMRLSGASYLDVLRAGGGILASTRMTRAATEEQLIKETTKRLDRFLIQGVTTVEAKSGYGLTVEDECKQLRVAKRLHQMHPVDIVCTFMGGHAVPPEYKEDPEAYVDLIIEEMLPRVAQEGLAEFCDVFCEAGVFTVAQSERILEAAKKVGLRPKIHADEIESMGGAELAAKVGAISADHLLQASDEGIKKLAESGVIAILLPGTAFYLMASYARARDMIARGVAVALSTDANPGSSPTQSLQLIMNLACLNMKMKPAEVVTATTINAAHAIDRAHEIGSIEVGKQADLVIMNAPNYLFLQYQYGMNLVDTVIKKGHVVVMGGRRVNEVLVS